MPPEACPRVMGVGVDGGIFDYVLLMRLLMSLALEEGYIDGFAVVGQ